MKKKSFPFSLIEIIIATSLFAILIFSTTSLFFRYHKLSAHIAMIRPKVFERALFFDKMTEMSDSIDAASIETKSYDHEQFLSFVFDNGFKDNAALSGECVCQIYRTIDKNLYYKISNNQGKETARIILQNIESFKAEVENQILTITFIEENSGEIKYSFILPAKGGL